MDAASPPSPMSARIRCLVIPFHGHNGPVVLSIAPARSLDLTGTFAFRAPAPLRTEAGTKGLRP